MSNTIKESNARDLWQSLMDDAYDRWKDENDQTITNYEEMLEKVPRLNKIAVLLGNLNYQVENGGWEQWVDNGYAIRYPEVLDALGEINTSLSNKVSSMIEELAPYIDESAKNRGFFGDYWIDEGYEYEEVCDEVEQYDEDTDEIYYEEECWDEEVFQESSGRQIAHDLDSKYYAINDEFIEEVANWFLDEIAKEET